MNYFTPGANVSERQTLPPPVAVSTVIFAIRDRKLSLPLVKRIKKPFMGDWALPGGPVTWEESLTDVARRALKETTGLMPRYLEQLYTFGELERSRAERIISIVYWAQLDAVEVEQALENVQWFEVRALPSMAFDHTKIVEYAVQRLQSKVNLAAGFLDGAFTLGELREVYEAILSRRLDAPNFRRRILASGMVEETGATERNSAHRPAKLYKVKTRAQNPIG